MHDMRAGSKHLIREINEAIVLNAIRTRGMLSRTDIAALVHLSVPTVSGITAELLDAGLIYEHTVGVSTGGRRPVLLALNNDAGYVVGVKLTETHAIAVLTDLAATILSQHTMPLVDHTPAAVVQTLETTVAHLRAQAGNQNILGVGVGIAGVVDRQRALVQYGTYFGWRNVPLAAMLEQRLNISVIIDNDVNALTAAEQWFGAGRGAHDFIVVSIGRGVGLGMVLDGQLYRGTAGGAGEFGHVTVLPNGPRCTCGKHGCLEALVSDAAVLQRLAAELGGSVDMAAGIARARSGDAVARSVFADAGRMLGMAVANLVNVLNPALLVLGGEGTRAGELIIEPFQAALREQCFTGLYDDLRVVIEPWGDDAWARGAASLLLGELFQPALRQADADRPSLAARTSA